MNIEQQDPKRVAIPKATTSGGVISAIRQWQFPREFRIAAPIFPKPCRDVLSLLLRQEDDVPTADTRPNAQSLDGFLADLGTSLWRLRQKMLRPGSEQPSDEMRRPFRHAQAMWDALNQAGVDIHDHTGEVVPEGGDYGLKILASQPTAGVGREMVLETIKPTIRWHRRTIQMGEVVLVRPDPGTDESPTSISPGDRGMPMPNG